MANEELPHPAPDAEPPGSQGGFDNAPLRAMETENTGETAKLMNILGEYEDIIGEGYEVTAVGEAGYVVSLGKEPNKYGDWLFWDVDDTALGYTPAKPVRQENYEQYLEDNDISLSPSEAKTLVDTTDKLSRWEDRGREKYHLDAHIGVLARLTESASSVPPDEKEEWIANLKDTVDQVIRDKPETTPDSVPFYFADGQLVIKDDAPGVDREGGLYEEVFNAMVRPERHQDVIDTMIQIENDTHDKPFRINQGLFTYGISPDQLRKSLEMIRIEAEKGRSLPISAIMLSELAKDEYFDELLKLDPATNPSAPRDTAIADILSDAGHTILQVDDSQAEIDSLLAVDNNGHGEVRNGLGFAAIRYRRQGMKNADTPLGEWHDDARQGIHQHSNPGVYGLRGDIYKAFLDNGALPRTQEGVPDEWTIRSDKLDFYEAETDGRARHYALYTNYGSDFAQNRLRHERDRAKQKWAKFAQSRK